MDVHKQETEVVILDAAEHCYHGPITKHGSGHARWLLVQAAQHLDRHPGPLGVFFRRLLRKKSRNVAVVATARKLVVIAWHMLRNNEPYRYAQPYQTREKLARLRRRAGDKHSRRGLAKGSPRPAAYGTGVRTRAVPNLAEAYASEGLPAPLPLAPGERRMLQQQQLTDFVESLEHSRREPRAPRQAAKKNPQNNSH
ncbi:MAG: hypothetical protein KBD01_14240 [Acidobacteria bacterium]|nr:hypothetical protein [Acidobacteriota bacterium]